MAIKFGPNTNLVIDNLKFSAVVNTDKEVKLQDVPAHHPIRCACIKKAASQTFKRGANRDNIGADVIIGCIPIIPKSQTTKGRKTIIIQKGKSLPMLFSIKFWISTEPLSMEPKNIDIDINNISSPEFWIKFLILLRINFNVSGLLNIWKRTKIGITITIACKAVLSKKYPTHSTDPAKTINLEKIGLTHAIASTASLKFNFPIKYLILKKLKQKATNNPNVIPNQADLFGR